MGSDIFDYLIGESIFALPCFWQDEEGIRPTTVQAAISDTSGKNNEGEA